MYFYMILGSFVITKTVPKQSTANIHSKPVGYTSNGGGRDSYISSNAGGMKAMHQNANYKRTFYNNLR